uniref:Transposase n=1 Tax=Ascaris lumbricoides TaxID=6252 RepID=A0A0M3HJ45_ASCLU
MHTRNEAALDEEGYKGYTEVLKWLETFGTRLEQLVKRWKQNTPPTPRNINRTKNGRQSRAFDTPKSQGANKEETRLAVTTHELIESTIVGGHCCLTVNQQKMLRKPKHSTG